MTASEIFESVTGSGSSDFGALVSILNRHGPWCLIGGLAVNCFVEPVYTLDADIVVISPQLPAISDELRQVGFSVREFAHSLNVNRPGSDLRIQLSLDPRYQEFLKDTNSREVLGCEVPVATLRNVIRGKIWAWSDPQRRPTKRKKDELDLMRILETYAETREWMPEEIKRQIPLG
ncbi:MAG TPA: hypothetical protein VJ124_13360 [Pyrinomonadaceae bacterium]|nr:hypothetical protein [Pyrinomonadaceae bacterium]